MTTRFLFAILSIVLVSSSGCITQPDEKTGGDGERHQGKPFAIGKWESDSVDYSGGDRTDWKILDCQDTGFLTLEVVLDTENANVVVALFDRYGKPISRVAHRKGDAVQVKLTAEVGIGKYFVQVYAEKESDKSGYAMRAIIR